MDEIMNGRFNRVIATIAVLLIFFREYEIHELPAAIGLLAALLYTVLLWTREKWWNAVKYICISTFMIAAAGILHYFYGVTESSLLWPLVYILATVHGEHGRLASILATVTIAAILFLSYPYSSPIELFFAFAGLFVGVRSRRIRQDAYRISQLHLEELNEAHKKLQETYAELQEATVHSMRYAALEERTRLAREIHDGLGHELTSLIVQLQALEIMLPQNPEKASQNVSQLLDISRQAMAEVRMAVREWSDDDTGLGLIALKGLVSKIRGRSSVACEFVLDSEVSEWPVETGIVLYRVLQESLTNVLRHSNATSVLIRLKEADERIVMTVSDNGQYTDHTPLIPGFGLKGILERCRLHGGTCSFSSEKPHGLRIEVALPIVPIESGGIDDTGKID
ncbi:sensor histidine kinase [Gordoniibacillus kamchatkensis]|nr:sensor histidine kinase [Paenibacillus sp. VKM B-2647]